LPAEAGRPAAPEVTVAVPAPVTVESPPVAVVRADPAPPPPALAPPRPAGGRADPAPLSDSESDPFSVLGTAYYHDGRLSVRAGRKIRSRRPRIGLAGQVDLYQRKTAQITLRVATDAAGNVTGVDILRSSGSNEIDQPCRVAMYDWWFEPKKDAAGNSMPDTFNFTIAFQ
jgi:TonB family protein